MARTRQAINEVINYLQQEFEVTLGDAKIFVGIKIERDCKQKLIKLTQKIIYFVLLNDSIWQMLRVSAHQWNQEFISEKRLKMTK